MERALKTIGMALGIIVTAGTIGAAVSRAVAREIVAPVAAEVAQHKGEQSELPAVLKQMNKKLDALCRAHPAAECPLGERE